MTVSLHPDLFQILRGYAALIPPRCLQFPPHLSTQLIHDVLLEHVLLSPHFQLYPPSRQYQKAFWKCIISHLENKLEVGFVSRFLDPIYLTRRVQSETEIDPRIYEHYLDLMNASALHVIFAVFSDLDGQRLPGQGPPSQSYVTHFWKLDNDRTTSPSAPVDLGAYQTTTLLESRTLTECGTTGLRTWLASLVLAQYLIHNPALVQRKRILELGSGIGFLGSVVASLQLLVSGSDTSGFASPGMVCLSDVNDAVLLRCRDNVHLPCNRSASHTDMRCCFLDWSAALDPDGIAPLASLLHDDLDADLILGADIVRLANTSVLRSHRPRVLGV
ncbi:hypothetical protein GGX14DRAFT_524451 [Mycena pura]|uniref:Uncharacterized protein n=1 Tax=Mycena pura TaxID=153505 RepID=A0AAD6VA66_9AGAR|nr:hypothetical protein GGX14DRAFT_524451 [Mycena pura]